MPLSDQDKTAFLDCLRAGGDQAICARRINRTATQIRRMLNETGRSYDPHFAAAVSEAIRERDPAGYDQRERFNTTPPASRTNGIGNIKADHLNDQELETFLEHVRAGVPQDIAAKEIKTALAQIKRRAARDNDFGEQYEAALVEGYPHYKDRLRSLAYTQAANGNYQALRDLLIVHAEEYDKLQTTRREIGGIGGGPLRVLAAALPMLPGHLLDEIQAAVASGDQQKALEAAKVIDQ